MLTGTPAFIAMVGTLLVVGGLVLVFRRAMARADEEQALKDAQREAYGRQLLEYAAQGHVNVPDGQGRTPLLLALEEGLDDVATQMLAHRPDLSVRDVAGNTALHYAALKGADGILHGLLHAGIDPRAANDRGETPLNMAAAAANPRVVELLLQYGADPNHQDPEFGHTPLMTATLHARMDNVELLLGAGADLSLQDRKGETVVQMAQREMPRRMGAYAEQNTTLANLVLRLEAAESGKTFRPYVYRHGTDDWDAGGPGGGDGGE